MLVVKWCTIFSIDLLKEPKLGDSPYYSAAGAPKIYVQTYDLLHDVNHMFVSDAVLIAALSANILEKLANGLCDNSLVSTLKEHHHSSYIQQNLRQSLLAS
jgi:phosphopantothenoylcysteine synthetase/decarboxylase